MKVHANAPLGPKGRETMVLRVLDQGWSRTEAAMAAGVSERTCLKWVRRYLAEGEAALLVVCLVGSQRKRHRLGGDLVSALEVDEAVRAGRAVAVGDVAGQRERERVPVEVIGVLDDELADRQKVTFDAV